MSKSKQPPAPAAPSTLETDLADALQGMQDEQRELLALDAEGAPQDMRQTARGCASLIGGWERVLRRAAETISARETVLRHAREVLQAALDRAADETSAGVPAAKALADVQARLDKALPVRQPSRK